MNRLSTSLLFVHVVIILGAAVASAFDLSKDDAPNEFIETHIPSAQERDTRLVGNFQSWVRSQLPPAEWGRRKWKIQSMGTGRGYGIVATERIAANESLVRVPLKMQLNYLVACRGPAAMARITPRPLCDLLHRITEDASAPGSSSLYRKMLRRQGWAPSHRILLTETQSINTALLVALVKFCRSCRDNKLFQHPMSYSPWVDFLQVDVQVPVCSFNAPQLQDESFPLSDFVRQRRRLIAEQFDYVRAMLARGQHSAGGPSSEPLLEDEWLTLPRFMWAMCHVGSRIFTVPARALDATLVPVIDMANHHPTTRKTFAFDSPPNKPLETYSELKIAREFDPEEEIVFAYFKPGSLNGHELFIKFGMLDLVDPCAVVNLGRELPASFESVTREHRMQREGENVFACFRPERGEETDCGGMVDFLAQRVEVQLKETERCLKHVKTGLSRAFCEQQERLLLRLLVRLQRDMLLAEKARGDL